MIKNFELEKHIDETKDKPYMLEFKVFPDNKEMQVKILAKYNGAYIVARHVFKRRIFKPNVDHWTIGMGYRRFFKGKYYSVPFTLHQILYFDNEKECDLIHFSLNVYLDKITKEQYVSEISERVYQKIDGSRVSSPSSGRLSRSDHHSNTGVGMWNVGVNTSNNDDHHHKHHHGSNDNHHDHDLSPSYDSGGSSGDSGGGCE